LDGPNVTLPAGRASFELPLGPLLVRVERLPVDPEPFVGEHYSPFVRPPGDAGEADLLVECAESSGIVVDLPPSGGSTRLELTRRSPGVFDIRSHWQSGYVDVRAGRGELILTNRTYLAFRMSLENYLRVASQLMLVERDAFLLHGAGILDQGRCYALFGPSGSGKSTATALSEPRRALSDDIVLIDARESAPLAHSVPFFGAYPPGERVRGSWPLAAMARLRQSEDVRARPLSLARAVATVSASVPFIHELGLRHDGLTRTVAKVCQAIPVLELDFRKDDSFWRCLNEAAGVDHRSD
jgi:hypothetical protein